MSKLLFLVTEDWYFRSHRLALAEAAIEAGYEVVLLARVGTSRAVIEASGIRVIELGWERGRFGLGRELRAWWRIARAYRSERPDIVHHVALKPALYGSLAAVVGSVPVVVNAIAGFGFLFISRRRSVRLARWGLVRGFRWLFNRHGTQVIVQNPEDREAVLSWGVLPRRVSIIEGVGVDTSHFAPARGGGADRAGAAHPVVVTIVARMLWDKGIAELVEAARDLRERGLAVLVQLAGSADDANPASIPAATLREWTAAGWIDWLGPVEDVASLWHRSHIAVLPSYREGLPLSLLEAAACARPLVATDVPGCRSVVLPGQNGLLVPPRDARALADAIATLVEDEPMRLAFGAASRALVETRFAKAAINAKTLSVYRDALDQSCSAPVD